jgi:hypothetical protein
MLCVCNEAHCRMKTHMVQCVQGMGALLHLNPRALKRAQDENVHNHDQQLATASAAAHHQAMGTSPSADTTCSMLWR